MGESILVVDDEQPMRFMVRRLLESSGYGVLEAESGGQALDVLKSAPADLVITDMKMPGMDGLTLAKTLVEQDPDRPVLLMTAFADLDSARRALKVGSTSTSSSRSTSMTSRQECSVGSSTGDSSWRTGSTRKISSVKCASALWNSTVRSRNWKRATYC